MKQITSTFSTIIVCFLVFVLINFTFPNNNTQVAHSASQVVQENQPSCDASRTVQVNGSATVKVVPDRVLIQLGVQSNGSTPNAVQDINSKAILKVIKSLQSLGIQPKDIATDWYIIEPVYESYDSLYIKGYRINNVIAVTLRDVSKVSQVTQEALEAGANQIINVEFYSSELRKYRDQARELAMKAASEKARLLASAAGSEIGCVLTINENTRSYYYGWWYGRDRNLWTQNVTQNATPTGDTGSSSGDEPFSLGQISISAEVGMTFELK